MMMILWLCEDDVGRVPFLRAKVSFENAFAAVISTPLRCTSAPDIPIPARQSLQLAILIWRRGS